MKRKQYKIKKLWFANLHTDIRSSLRKVISPPIDICNTKRRCNTLGHSVDKVHVPVVSPSELHFETGMQYCLLYCLAAEIPRYNGRTFWTTLLQVALQSAPTITLVYYSRIPSTTVNQLKWQHATQDRFFSAHTPHFRGRS